LSGRPGRIGIPETRRGASPLPGAEEQARAAHLEERVTAVAIDAGTHEIQQAGVTNPDGGTP
jgi:hypothetical protein